MPLNKEKVITVNIETENKISLGDALLKAIQGFNKIDENFRIMEKTALYKLRYAKKSGLPDKDIPRIIFIYFIKAFDLNLKLNRINCLSFSIAIDESHLFSIPKYNHDPAASKNLNRMNTTCVSISKDDIVSTEFFSPLDQKRTLIGDEEEKRKKEGFFARFCKCLIKKKS